MSKTEEKSPGLNEEAVADERVEYIDTDTQPGVHLVATRPNTWISVVLSCVAVFSVGLAAWFGWQELQSFTRSMQSIDSSVQGLSAKIAQFENLKVTTQELDNQIQRLESEVERTDARNQSVIDRVEMVAEQLAKAQVDTRSS